MGRRLSERLDGHGCEPLPEFGVRVRIDTLRYPDMLIDCDPPGDGGDRIAVRPTVAFEVLSPTTRYVDVRAKVPEYRSVPAIVHIVLIDVAGIVTVHDRDGEAGTRPRPGGRSGRATRWRCRPSGSICPCVGSSNGPCSTGGRRRSRRVAERARRPT